jgi:hypothetical protein
MKKYMNALCGLAMSAGLAACGPNVEGDWVATERVGSERNEMTIDGDGEGEATIWFVVAYEGEYYLASADFDFTSEIDGDDVEFDMECKSTDLGPCGSAWDFTMDCKLKADGEELDCSGNGAWRDYDFEWERR